MEKTIEEVPLKSTKNQFWGAIKIYTEKPHVINRRICGTINVWIATTHNNFHREAVVKDLYPLLSYSSGPRKDDSFQISPESALDTLSPTGSESPPLASIENKVSSTEESSVTTSLDNDYVEPECQDGLVEKIKEVFWKEGFKNLGDSKGHTEDRMEEQEDSNLPSKCSNAGPKVSIPWQELMKEDTLRIVVIRQIIPKQLKKTVPTYEVIIMEKPTCRVTYLNQRPPSSTLTISPRLHYAFTLNGSTIALSRIKDNEEDALEERRSVTWVQTKVLPKLVKWAGEVEEDGVVEEKGSLRLLEVQEYNHLYQKLKMKYGKKLVQMWPESTDPLKYVYEDIAIATYLLLLWQQERNTKGLTQPQSFVDLGCGNGLLVYLLNSEGHPGFGIDIKKRNIWDMFSDNIDLKEGVVEPSDKNLFPEHDWLIGNHSDELTPWLPVIAAKSKHTTRFFVIPCCAHDFDSKYRRRISGRSQYSDYLEYVKEVGTVCGFEIWQDKLRIPSTKRVCLIGQDRTYSEEESAATFERIDSFIKLREKSNCEAKEEQERKGGSNNSEGKDELKHRGNGLWSDNFKAREAVQQVRNCTQLNKGVREDLILTVANKLMEKKHIIQVKVEEAVCVDWDRGGSMTLADLAKSMEPEQRQALKKECGGLQTLVKNHKHMFALTDGKVSMQSPVPLWAAKVPSERIKTKVCWFHENHRRGCPLPSHLCIFAHGQDDLKQPIPSS